MRDVYVLLAQIIICSSQKWLGLMLLLEASIINGMTSYLQKIFPVSYKHAELLTIFSVSLAVNISK